MPISAAASRASSRDVARRVRAEPGRHAARAHLDDAADGVALARAPRRCGAAGPPRRATAPATSIVDRREQRLRDRARGDEHRGVPRARALERVARVVEAVLQRAGEVGVARAAAASPASCPCPPARPRAATGSSPTSSSCGRGCGRRARAACRACARAAGRRAPRPRPSRSAAAGCGRSPAGAGAGRRRSRRGRATSPAGRPVTIATSAGPVRLAGGDERERHGAERTAFRITSSGAGTPVQRSNDAAPCRTSTSSPSITVAPAARAAARRRAVRVRQVDERLALAAARTAPRPCTGVACTTRSASRTSGGQSPRREKTRALGHGGGERPRGAAVADDRDTSEGLSLGHVQDGRVGARPDDAPVLEHERVHGLGVGLVAELAPPRACAAPSRSRRRSPRPRGRAPLPRAAPAGRRARRTPSRARARRRRRSACAARASARRDGRGARRVASAR